MMSFGLFRQRDKETAAANMASIARSTSFHHTQHKTPPGCSKDRLVRQSTDLSVMSNDVFEEDDTIDTISR